jgi:hypothetical protein
MIMDDCLIAPDGDLIPVTGIGGHIQTVIAYPEIFGLTREYIKGVYKERSEFISEEGNARDFILTELYKKGWIRVGILSMKGSMGGWGEDISIDLWVLDNSARGRLRNWARGVIFDIGKDEASKIDVVVYTLSDGAEHSAGIMDVAGGIIAKQDGKFKKLSLRR